MATKKKSKGSGSAKPAKKTKSASTKTASRKPSLEAEQVYEGLRSIHSRLTELELSIRQLRGTSVAASPFAAAADAATDMVSIGFKKTAGPDSVRVTLLDTGEPVLRPFQSQGASKPRKRGEDINVKVEANGGAPVNIEVTNARPSPLDDVGVRLLTVG